MLTQKNLLVGKKSAAVDIRDITDYFSTREQRTVLIQLTVHTQNTTWCKFNTEVTHG